LLFSLFRSLALIFFFKALSSFGPSAFNWHMAADGSPLFNLLLSIFCGFPFPLAWDLQPKPPPFFLPVVLPPTKRVLETTSFGFFLVNLPLNYY